MGARAVTAEAERQARRDRQEAQQLEQTLLRREATVAERQMTVERLERDVLQASAEVTERPVVTKLPDITLKELLLVFKDALERSTMFAHHHVRREPLSVRERMSNILVTLQTERYVDFGRLFDPREGRIGVTVTFLAILELLQEQLIRITLGIGFNNFWLSEPEEVTA